ncbi:MAG: hypothetical protein J7L82_07445, partial [Staphylothermus sp.]|nr:hypothetical protein [Staphylothermus sp.]
KKQIYFTIPWREIGSSICGLFAIFIYSTVMGYSNYIVKSIYAGLPIISWIAISSLVIYLAVVYTLSPWFRDFVKISINELRRMISM